MTASVSSRPRRRSTTAILVWTFVVIEAVFIGLAVWGMLRRVAPPQ